MSRCLDAVDRTDAVVLDLRGLTLMDSPALAAILAARQCAALSGGTLQVLDPIGNVRAPLERTGLLEILSAAR